MVSEEAAPQTAASPLSACPSTIPANGRRIERSEFYLGALGFDGMPIDLRMTWGMRTKDAETKAAAKDPSPVAWPCCYSRCRALKLAKSPRKPSPGQLPMFQSIPLLEQPSSMPSRTEPRCPQNIVLPNTDEKPSPFAGTRDGKCTYGIEHGPGRLAY